MKFSRSFDGTKMVVGLLALVAGFLVGVFISQPSSDEELPSELRLGPSSFTNPLLECDLGRATIGSSKKDFTSDLVEFTDRLKEKGEVSEIAVYYRDLNNGPVFGVGHDTLFAPASLLKVPLMIAYLKWSEDVPGVMDEKMTYETPIDVGYQQQFAPIDPLALGRSYSARELLEQMVTYSDNQALILLFKKLPTRYQEELYDLLGVDASLITDPTATLTVKQYSIFFRILFNSSFLSRNDSEYALSLLTKTTFVDGLVAGVPKNIVVAHKFGERKIADGLQQFHDCGIIYYPNHPFLLCVMTRGGDVQALIGAIRDIAAFVYDKVDDQYR